MAVSEKKKASDYKWQRANMGIIAVNVRNTLKEEFRSICEQNGTTMNAVLLKALRDYMEGAGQAPPPAPFPLSSGWTRLPPSVLRTHRTKDGWQLDLDDDGRAWGAWLTHSSSSVKLFLAGADKSKHTLDEFAALIFNDIEEYMATYRREYME